VSLTVQSLDGAAHAVQVYSDLSAGAWCHCHYSLCLKFGAEWLSGDWSKMIVWSTTANDDVIYLMAQLQSQAVFNEISISWNGARCIMP
jgi:hypothetical protein